jgi:hypothetical protein
MEFLHLYVSSDLCINRNNINADHILRLLHRVDLGDATNVSEVYSLSIIRVEVCRLANVTCIPIARQGLGKRISAVISQK